MEEQQFFIDDTVVYTGEILKEAVIQVRHTRDMWVEGLIPHKSNTMIFAPDGAGKSVVLIQALLEGSGGVDVFGGMKSKPFNSIVYMTERPKEETFERMQYMMAGLKIDWERIIVDDTVRGLDVCSPADFETLLKKAARHALYFQNKGGVNVIAFDTLYGIAPAGLSSETSVGQVNRLLRKLQAAFDCSTVFTHHTNRGARNAKTNKREGEDMYGNRSLSANCTGIFHLTQTETGTSFEKKKDTLACLSDTLQLKFDPETYLSRIPLEQSTKYRYQKICEYFKRHFQAQKEFTFNQILEDTEVSYSYLRNQLSVHLKDGVIENCKPLGQKALYRVLRVV